jgi:hypothetical protein
VETGLFLESMGGSIRIRRRKAFDWHHYPKRQPEFRGYGLRRHPKRALGRSASGTFFSMALNQQTLTCKMLAILISDNHITNDRNDRLEKHHDFAQVRSTVAAMESFDVHRCWNIAPCVDHAGRHRLVSRAIPAARVEDSQCTSDYG